ncbi:hypothetical protein SteCoe_25331 [Stentor coeruleus]|uniref:Uncharacterized protein n=1 Tax=Stentor coeruleus TaxID=5963 RepID=A0A1R2BFG2_9CILI|nr:hypothetical protein SteCoe_25331 [Stentor coeruleus]
MQADPQNSSAEVLRNRILSFTFNQTKVIANQTLLCIGTTMGFRIVRIEDCKITSARDKLDGQHFEGGFSCVSSMFSTQLICIVGSPENTHQTPNILYFWDEYHSQLKAEIRFRSTVKNVLMRRDKIVIVLEKIVNHIQTYIYLLNTLKPIASISTIENDYGVGSISTDPEVFVLGTLDTTKGHVRIENFYTNEIKRGHMHDNNIVIMEMNSSGTLAASASELGTVIRVFDTRTLNVMYELRRGTSAARITSIAFSPEGSFLIATSNKSTVHIWNLNLVNNDGYTGMVTRFLPTYFQYTRSYFKLNIQPENRWSFSDLVPPGPVACFTSESVFCVAHLDGNLYTCRINADTATIEKSSSFIDMDEVYRIESK